MKKPKRKRFVLTVQSLRPPYPTDRLTYATEEERDQAAEEYRRIGYSVAKSHG